MRSSERISNKVVPMSQIQERGKSYDRTTPQVQKKVTPLYCRDCDKRDRGNTWQEDYCRWKKMLCSEARKAGNMTIKNCKGHPEYK